MNYVGWMYNDETGNSGSLVEDDDGNTVAWFVEADDAIAYVAMSAALAAAEERAAAAERDAAIWKEFERKSSAELTRSAGSYVRVVSTLKSDLDAMRKRAEEAEAALAAVPVGAIRLVVWMMDDGPYDEMALDQVSLWLDTQDDHSGYAQTAEIQEHYRAWLEQQKLLREDGLQP